MILGMDAWIFWMILTVIFIVIELATINLVTIWFAGGTLAALIASLCGVSPALQTIIAVAVAGVLLVVCIVFKPFDKFKKHQTMPTNSDRVIGQVGVVIEKLDKIRGKGLVKVMGQTWSAVSQTGEDIEEGIDVEVCSISGVRLIVKPIEK